MEVMGVAGTAIKQVWAAYIQPHWKIILSIVLGISVFIAFGYAIWKWVQVMEWGPGATVGFMPAIKSNKAKNLSNDILPNLNHGALSFWTYKNNWNTGYKQTKTLFIKGTSFRIYLHKTDNTLCITVPLRADIIEAMAADSGEADADADAETTTSTTLKITNFPLARWNHIAVSFADKSIVDVWLNGKLVLSTRLPRLDPLSKEEKSIVFPSAETTPLDAQMSSLLYFDEPLTPQSAQKLSRKGPIVRGLLATITSM
jgi:hypothetical protein